MNSKDIWQIIFKFLPIPHINRLRVLSKTHNTLADLLVNDKILRINETNLPTIARIIYQCASVKSMHISTYTFKWKNDYNDDDEDIQLFDETDVQNIIDGKKMLYLPHKLSIHNPMGINHDKRGCKKAKKEFKKYHSHHTWEPGYYSINSFSQGFFHLKSHKFENWYEMIVGITKMTHCNCRFNCRHKCTKTFFDGERFEAKLYGDHGS